MLDARIRELGWVGYMRTVYHLAMQVRRNGTERGISGRDERKVGWVPYMRHRASEPRSIMRLYAQETTRTGRRDIDGSRGASMSLSTASPFLRRERYHLVATSAWRSMTRMRVFLNAPDA